MCPNSFECSFIHINYPYITYPTYPTLRNFFALNINNIYQFRGHKRYRKHETNGQANDCHKCFSTLLEAFKIISTETDFFEMA